jgi:hypothetical protein
MEIARGNFVMWVDRMIRDLQNARPIMARARLLSPSQVSTPLLWFREDEVDQVGRNEKAADMWLIVNDRRTCRRSNNLPSHLVGIQLTR